MKTFSVFDCVRGEYTGVRIQAGYAVADCRRFIREKAMSAGIYWIEKSNVRNCAHVRSTYGSDFLLSPLKEETNESA